MSGPGMQEEAPRLPDGHVASFLQLSFDPQLLDRPGSNATRQQQAVKPSQQQAASQRPPVPHLVKPPAQHIAAAVPAAAPAESTAEPTFWQEVQKQHHEPQAAPSASASALSRQVLEQVFATRPVAPPAAAQQSCWGQHAWMQQSGLAPGMDPTYQQYSQQYMQFDPQQYAAATAAAGYGYGAGFMAADGYPAAAGYYNDVSWDAAAGSYVEGGGYNHQPKNGKGKRPARGRRGTSSEPASEGAEDCPDQQQQQQPAAKRRKKDQPGLEAESQLLLLGFLSAVVGDNAMLEQCLVHAVSFETQQEAALQQQMMMMGTEAMQQPANKVSVLKQYQLAQSLAKNVRSRAALSLVWQLPVVFNTARGMLAVGGVFGLDDVLRECTSELTLLVNTFDFDAAGLRKSKVDGQAEALNDTLRDTLNQLLVEAGHVPEKTTAQRAAQPSRPLPRCVLANREPFAHKEWRKEPYDPRPYINLTDYAITTNVPREFKQLKWKLSTRRRDAAGDGFAEKHHDLTPQQLQEEEQHLVQQVLHRQALVKNRDVVEVDCWGMDCYTRRNVFDAVLEADVFQHLRPTQQQQQQLETLEPQQQQGQRQDGAAQGSQQQLVKAEFEQQQPAGDVTHICQTEKQVDAQQQQQSTIADAVDKAETASKQPSLLAEQLQPPPQQPQQAVSSDQQQPDSDVTQLDQRGNQVDAQQQKPPVTAAAVDQREAASKQPSPLVEQLQPPLQQPQQAVSLEQQQADSDETPLGQLEHQVDVQQQQHPVTAAAVENPPAASEQLSLLADQIQPPQQQQAVDLDQQQQRPRPVEQQQQPQPQQQQQQQQHLQDNRKSPSPAPAAEQPGVKQQLEQQQQRLDSPNDEISPESNAGAGGGAGGDGGDDHQRRSKRARKRVLYADEAMEELKAQAREHKKSNREALRAKYYPPKESNYSKAEEDAVHEWIDDVFLPAVNAAGNQGWDMVCVATNIKEQAEARGNKVNAEAADAILNQFNNSGYPWFRLHPKGRGVIVTRPAGVAPFTFVEEYLGEVHTGWRWFEIQDAIKKITQKDLPDFYNIALERPRDDPDGYDILFVDAAFQGSFASRMSHSCTPNCQAVVVSSGGRLTVALYTIRHVAAGEELTFDYSCVTESEDEFKQAYCMCSTRHCRGSFLYYTGSKAYMQVLEEKHTFLDRQALLLRCCTEPLSDADKARLETAGLRGSVLGRTDIECNPETPDWLKKWAALTLQFVDLERHLLPGELQALPPPLTQTLADSVAAAVGVELNRLQNVCISLDKAKHCLNQPGQCRDPPLALLTDEEVAEYLWNGERSMARRAVKAASAQILEQEDADMVQAASTAAEYQAAAQHLQYSYPLLAVLLTKMAQTVDGATAAREELQRVVAQLRDIDIVVGGGHTRAADVLQLYASTQVWFTSNKDYISFSSPPLQLHEEMITMHGGLDTAVDTKKGVRRSNSGTGLGPAPASGAASSGGVGAGRRGVDDSSDDEYDPAVSSEDEEAVRRKGAVRGRGRWGAAAGRGGATFRAVKGINPKVLEKRYGPHYIWAQLSSWFKQTVYDPTASLSADRRGTLSLPEVESCYTTKERYDSKERQRLISHVLRTPERQWTSSAWSFKNEAKVYGSPMFDAFWGEVMQGVPRSTPLERLAETLKTAAVPYGLGGSGGAKGEGGKAATKKGKGGKAAGGGSSRTAGSTVKDGGAVDDGADEQQQDEGHGVVDGN